MRICIPVRSTAKGGAHHFLASWETYLTAQGITVVNNLLARYEALFLNSWLTHPDKVAVGMARNPGAHVVQRVDGAAQDYGRTDNADARQAAVNQLADLTIFQSEYSRFATREKFPLIQQDGPVIYNPVDANRFTPHGPTRNLPGERRIAYVSWSANPLKGWQDLYTAAAQHQTVDFFLAGNAPDPPALPNLHLQGALDHKQLAVLLRSCDALLTFSRNEACPNHVLEALSSGLPVLYLDSGAAAELVGDAGLPVTVETLGPVLEQLWQSLPDFARRARDRATGDFAPDVLFGRYLQAIHHIREQSPRIDRFTRWRNAARRPRLWLSLMRQKGI